MQPVGKQLLHSSTNSQAMRPNLFVPILTNSTKGNSSFTVVREENLQNTNARNLSRNNNINSLQNILNESRKGIKRKERDEADTAVQDTSRNLQKSNWLEAKNRKGETYFYNTVTKEYSWSKPDDEAQPHKKKCNWTEERTPAGKTFYFNHLTKQSFWEKPEELQPKKCYWIESKDENGQIYFYNRQTKHFSWEKPEEMKSFENLLPPPTQEAESARENYQALAALEDVDLVPNAEPFECPVCIKYVAKGEGVVLHACLHSFCKECLAGKIELSETALIRCPFQNAEYACESYLQDREIKSLVTPNLYQVHLQRSMYFPCCTPFCSGGCLYKDYSDIFLCPVCKKNNCLVCTAIHEEMTCEQYQDSVALSNKRPKENSREFKIKKIVDKEINHAVLTALEEKNLVSNSETFECPICFTHINSGEGVILHDCLHSFCKECLAGVVQHSETVIVKCPFQNDEYACESHLQEREIKSLVTPEIYEKHLQRSMTLAESQAPNSFHCKTTDCPGWCLYEDNVNVFVCPVCSKNNCLTCAAIHEGRNCKQYQDFVAFNCDTNEEARRTKLYLQAMLMKGGAMECPKCHIIIMKKDGCDALLCSMCRLEICWVTKGPRWGPKGHGDTSGGCKCNYMGKRCHPKCKGCH